MKKQIPLLMSLMMVQAILALRKLMTRRVKGLEAINESPDKWDFSHFERGPDGSLIAMFVDKDCVDHIDAKCPYGKPGDILYVRENWFPAAINGNKILIGVDPKDSTQSWEIITDDPAPYWKKMNRGRMIPSIHMPKEASRIWLEVTGIGVERLQDISEEDAKAEGLAAITKDDGRTWKYGIPDKDGYPGTDDNGWPWHKWSTDPKESFFRLWTQINGGESLRQDPWLWVVSFRVLSTTGKPAELEKEEANG